MKNESLHRYVPGLSTVIHAQPVFYSLFSTTRNVKSNYYVNLLVNIFPAFIISE
jgi:hypothetical protein